MKINSVGIVTVFIAFSVVRPASCQSSAFEAAVIRPSLPIEQQKIAHVGVMIDTTHVDMGYQSLEDLIARAHALVAGFADRAAQCEANCRVSDEAVGLFRETGLHKTLLPAAYGGHEMGFSAMLETSFAIGKVCASSAWV